MDAVQRIAVVDLGTNSTRLLVADVDAGGRAGGGRAAHATSRGSAQGVDASGRLARGGDGAGARAASPTTARLADRHGAERSVAVATSAVRDADNGAEFRAAVRERFGFDVRTISGDEEARLTFLGATAGRPAGGGRRW